ncbi:hypothetical protein F2Q68_00036263 [Brassica cretica]|uniref:Uncharacterized protein n=1 Tax=Brassica cretica TaxID=69181 RepID=A0A8S9H457_BRACR|nr:hypothetical protein F2Q68_00036263 [Brassica cretica]
MVKRMKTSDDSASVTRELDNGRGPQRSVSAPPHTERWKQRSRGGYGSRGDRGETEAYEADERVGGRQLNRARRPPETERVRPQRYVKDEWGGGDD